MGAKGRKGSNRPRAAKFSIVHAPELAVHLQAIDRKHHTMIRRTIREWLEYEPDTTTRNRKPLRQPAAFDEAWEIRFGPANRLRVFYRVDRSRLEVHVLAVGIKEGNVLRISGREFQL